MFKHFSGPYTGQSLTQVVADVVKGYGLSNSMYTITVNTAFNYGPLCQALELMLQNKKIV